MKIMKLGTRPDTFFTSGSVRSVSTEVSTDLQIKVDNSLFRLHKFPLLSKCLRLQAELELDSGGRGGGAVELPGFPGGPAAFEACAKFCYGITITIGAHNVVPIRCAVARLGMTESADRGNLAAKLDAFLASCLLRQWKDALAVLRATRGRYATACEELGVTSRCVDAVAALIADHDGGSNAPAAAAGQADSSPPWWARDVAELGVDLYWRVMVSVKAASAIDGKAMGDSLKTYARRWLPDAGGQSGHRVEQSDAGGAGNADRSTTKNRRRLLLERIVSLLPDEKDAVSCSFLLKLLKAANVLGASQASKAELTRRAALQLEDAAVSDLLIPSVSAREVLYDVDVVVAILEEFAFRQPPPPPSSEPRRSTSSAVSQGAMVRVGKLVDAFLAVAARDINLPLEKLIAVAEAVPDIARPEHDGLYRAVDAYLKAHPEMDKSSRKRLCRVLDCRKLSDEACAHAAQNDLLPLRVVVQVLFFENARAAAAALPGRRHRGGVEALPAGSRTGEQEGGEDGDGAAAAEDGWSVEGRRRVTSKGTTLRMKLEEKEEADDETFVHRARAAGLARGAPSRARAFCAVPAMKPKQAYVR